jgi:hypothetical protein
MARDGSAMEDAFKPEAMCGSNDQQQKSAVSSTTS